MTDSEHEPVLVNEVITALKLQPDGFYLDATFGRGGHSRQILKQLSQLGRVIGLDKDQAAIDHAREYLEDDSRFRSYKSSFAKLDQVLSQASCDKKLDGMLFDFGVSSPQLDQAERGFSFLKDGPLDMRMDQSAELTAAIWLAQAEESELRKVFKQYGEERFASRIARAIVNQRATEPLETTIQLADLIKKVVPIKEFDKHPATRVFQAIRISINKELEEIAVALPQALKWLKTGGRLAVISFHSLEDRIVKQFFKNQAKGDDYPQDLPITADMLNPRLKIIGKPIRPTQAEIDVNPRSRSAILRVAEKIGEKI